jgi:hypothetical protein
MADLNENISLFEVTASAAYKAIINFGKDSSSRKDNAYYNTKIGYFTTILCDLTDQYDKIIDLCPQKDNSFFLNDMQISSVHLKMLLKKQKAIWKR